MSRVMTDMTRELKLKNGITKMPVGLEPMSIWRVDHNESEVQAVMNPGRLCHAISSGDSLWASKVDEC